MATTRKLTRNSPGCYTLVDALGREWTISRNPSLGSTPWVAYRGSQCVLDPFWTLRETVESIDRSAELEIANPGLFADLP